jgi:hypothetical protein
MLDDQFLMFKPRIFRGAVRFKVGVLKTELLLEVSHNDLWNGAEVFEERIQESQGADLHGHAETGDV